MVDGDHYLQRITDIQADAIKVQRDQLRELAEADARAVVIDHCEHFYIDGEPAVDGPGGLRGTVDELDQRVVAIHPERIAAAPERILVAGGLEKPSCVAGAGRRRMGRSKADDPRHR